MLQTGVHRVCWGYVYVVKGGMVRRVVWGGCGVKGGMPMSPG